MSNNSEPQKFKKISPILLFSGIIVMMSTLVLFIPFALYSVSQVCAMLGKRYGMLILFSVFAVLTVFSFLFGSPLLMSSAFLILICIPFFMASIAIREKVRQKSLAVFILFIPVIFVFSCYIYMPKYNSTELATAATTFEKSIEKNKSEIESNWTKSGDKNAVHPETQLLSKYDNVLALVENLKNSTEVQNFLAYDTWQRILWFVFGYGSIYFFFAILTTFANILFLDVAYEQVEKLRAIKQYVLTHARSFSINFIYALSRVPFVIQKNLKSNFIITQHESMSKIKSENFNSQPVRVIRLSLFKDLKPNNKILFKGTSFIFDGKLNTWNLKNYAVPLPLVFLSLFYMTALMIWSGGSNFLIQNMISNPFAPFIAIGCLFSFCVLTLLTLQGLVVFYLRVSNLLGLIILILLFLFGINFSVSYYALVAIFGAIALLDYIYDWRCKNKRL